MQQWLVKARLVLLGHQQDLVFLGVELLRQLRLLDAVVHVHFGEFLIGELFERYFARERHQRFHVGVALVLDVLIEPQLVAHGVLTRAGHYHRFGTTANLVAAVGAEVLHDHFDFLRDLVVMELDETR
ncbi:hypothetical protein D3C76_1431350 [compost metagenome]